MTGTTTRTCGTTRTTRTKEISSWRSAIRYVEFPDCPPNWPTSPEVEYRQLRLGRVVLVSVWTRGSQADADNAMFELKALAETAGSQVLDGLVQRHQQP